MFLFLFYERRRRFAVERNLFSREAGQSSVGKAKRIKVGKITSA